MASGPPVGTAATSRTFVSLSVWVPVTSTPCTESVLEKKTR